MCDIKMIFRIRVVHDSCVQASIFKDGRKVSIPNHFVLILYHCGSFEAVEKQQKSNISTMK